MRPTPSYWFSCLLLPSTSRALACLFLSWPADKLLQDAQTNAFSCVSLQHSDGATVPLLRSDDTSRVSDAFIAPGPFTSRANPSAWATPH